MTAPTDPVPRVHLRPAPATPLHRADRLSAELGIDLWFKRDDLTGIALGGNKVRVLEYLLGEAVADGADVIVTGAGAASNWAMLAAVAARTQGLDTHLVYYGDARTAPNLELARWIGAEIRFTGDPDRTSVDRELARLADELRAAGRTPFVIPRGGATATGCLGYLDMVAELQQQESDAGLRIDELWLPVGSCGTAAGIVAGVSHHDAGWRVTGVATSRPADESRARIAELAAAGLERIGSPHAVVEFDVTGDFLGDGYGVPSAAGARAAERAARAEGVLLDPVFGAKAMAGLLSGVESGAVRGTVVHLVSGGAPTFLGDIMSTTHSTLTAPAGVR